MERESSLGGRLRRLMEEEGLSYEQLGERLGMNPQTLNRYVLGQREPKIGTASAMAAALGVDPCGCWATMCPAVPDSGSPSPSWALSGQGCPWRPSSGWRAGPPPTWRSRRSTSSCGSPATA
ncbi:helix-turn-helix domain-containing protein [Flavonifractor plautii]|nr:helix-turn-helix domain-containing protein [Flavonifractor plautii]